MDNPIIVIDSSNTNIPKEQFPVSIQSPQIVETTMEKLNREVSDIQNDVLQSQEIIQQKNKRIQDIQKLQNLIQPQLDLINL